MPDNKSSPRDGGDENSRRNLPSWMSSRDKSNGKKPADIDRNEAQSSSTRSKEAKGREKTTNLSSFSKLMEGVVFVLSGFVNPERSTLRSHALEMGAEYQPDWNSDCTLLICAFPNTPKFRQVEADCGTIVSKEWILECYNQKKLVAIETYLMHAGKPWRKSLSHEANRGSIIYSVTKIMHGGSPNPVKERLSPSKVKKWAMDDLNKTISWLESQEETPEPSEVKKIAVEGILTCLQDAIESLEQNQDIQQVTEQWKFIPRVVEELAGLESTRNNSSSFSREDLCQQAMNCKHIYEKEFDSFLDDSTERKKKPKTAEDFRNDEKADINSTDAAYESDATVEMTEDEIDLAYKTIASKICKW
ncbi:BRCT domain [Macleaya cordata]|uniref:BRCT domain n=1 Tax=Macleaya cordata TaxID=56857 RepID=A0A200PN92_MACCD|nr:BRCT domain [Macleaya cordata]